jgi:hypothetical protein
MGFDARYTAVVDVCIDVGASQPEARADWCSGILGVNWPQKLLDRNELFELIEVGDLARWLGAEIGGLGQMGPRFFWNMRAKRHLLDALAKSTAGRTMVSRLFRFFDKSLIHELGSVLAYRPNYPTRLFACYVRRRDRGLLQVA